MPNTICPRFSALWSPAPAQVFASWLPLGPDYRLTGDTHVVRLEDETSTVYRFPGYGINAFHGRSAAEVYGVGSGIWRFDGQSWQEELHAPGWHTSALQGVWQAPEGDVFAVGNGFILRRRPR
jgi:hypothetical protein